MSLGDAADRLRQPVEGAAYIPAQRQRETHPNGWEPGVRYEPGGKACTVTTGPMLEPLETEADWVRVVEQMRAPLPEGFRVELAEAKYDPAAWHRDQQGEDAVTRAIWRYKFRVVYDPQKADDLDIEALVAEIRKDRPRVKAAPDGESAFVVLLSDWQIGKCDGDGLRGTVERVEQMILDVETRVRELRKAGRDLGTLYILGGGDLFEGCDGFYPTQTYGIEADRRDQVKIGRRLLRKAVKRWAPLFPSVVIAVVGGNHGENRKDGKAYTTLGDNDDLAVFEQLAEGLAENPDTYGHVSFVIPDDDLAITLQVAGHVLGLTHGHVARVTGSTPEAKIRRWYEQQAGGKRPAGDANILVTAHYHSFACADWGGCFWMQGGTLDGGSRWFTDTTGMSARAGQLTFTVHPEKFVRDIALI